MSTALASLTFDLLLRALLTVRRSCSARTTIVPLRPLATAVTSTVLRAVRHGPRSSLNHTTCNAILALPQLLNILELLVLDRGHLACIIPGSTLLPQLDQPFQNVMARWRRSSSDFVTRKRHQSYHSYTGQVATRPVRVSTVSGVSFFENHPFTIASLCSDDFPSVYGEQYRDMVLVFRPFGGFTKKVLESALEHGPWHTYRAFLDGPYGGMRRSLDSFDHVVMIAGGSGITAIVSQLLDLIKRMRDGKAVTKTVQLVWALKRPETIEWFKEELRICREFAPPNAVQCQFFITSAKRQSGVVVSAQTPSRPVSMVFHDKVNDVFQNIASNRFSTQSSNRNSAFIQAEAEGDAEREKELRYEDMDRLRPLPEAHYKTMRAASPVRSPSGLGIVDMPHMPPHPTLHEKRRSQALSLDLEGARQAQADQIEQLSAMHNPQQFDFGFPSTPTEFQKNLMRFAFMPAAVKARKSGWSTEWGRPDIPYMLRDMSNDWTGRRTAVFVCGPPSMRVDVSNTVADLQKLVLKGRLEEIYLHAENYAL